MKKFLLILTTIHMTAFCCPISDFLEREIYVLDGLLTDYQVQSGLDMQQLYYLMGMRDEAQKILDELNKAKGIWSMTSP